MQQVQANDKPNDAVNTTFSYQASLGDSAAPQMMTLLVSVPPNLQKLSMQGPLACFPRTMFPEAASRTPQPFFFLQINIW
jgi:hypothetical protein